MSFNNKDSRKPFSDVVKRAELGSTMADKTSVAIEKKQAAAHVCDPQGTMLFTTRAGFLHLGKGYLPVGRPCRPTCLICDSICFGAWLLRSSGRSAYKLPTDGNRQ